MNWLPLGFLSLSLNKIQDPSLLWMRMPFNQLYISTVFSLDSICQQTLSGGDGGNGVQLSSFQPLDLGSQGDLPPLPGSVSEGSPIYDGFRDVRKLKGTT